MSIAATIVPADITLTRITKPSDGQLRPNHSLQPKANGLPPLGRHFILAQSRQPVAFG